MNLFNAARRICESFTYDPGHSDLDNEQPIAIHCTLGDWRRLNSALMLAGQRADQPEETATTPEVRLNDDGTLDEVCGTGAHLEQMDKDHWFLEVLNGDKSVAVWLHSRSKIVATYERRDNSRSMNVCEQAETPSRGPK